jgi:diguanylate cyclase (GGDEF)-like protein
MAGRIAFALCKHYLREAQAAIESEKLANAIVVTFPARCGHPPLSREELTAVIGDLSDVEEVEVIGASCLKDLCDLTSHSYNIHIFKLDQCFNLAAGPAIINRCLERGAYLTTPGWLANWPANIEHLGLNQEMAREMFSETTKVIALLDTGVDEQSAANLRAFSEYVDRPIETICTGNSVLCLIFAKAHLTWQMEVQQKKSIAEIQGIQKQAATYAMAIDLLSNLARIVNETEAVEAMLDVYMFLFAPQRLCYLSFQEGMKDKFWIRPDVKLGDAEEKTIKNTLAGFHQESSYTESGKGFILRIAPHGEVRGVITVEEIAFPEYIDHYLNLALSIVNICELPIENARKYEKLVETEEMLRKANEDLLQLSTTDALTGIANRRAYDEYIEIEWKRMLRNKMPLSLIICDVDFFKRYNDHYGHKRGDYCLHTVAQIVCKTVLRPEDFIARYSGEEFIVVLPSTSGEGALHIAEKIRIAVVQYGITHEYSEVAPYVTLSLGIAHVQPPLTKGVTSASLFRAADTALYHAKNQGRNRTVMQTIESEEI